MSLIVDKEAVMKDVMRAINKHYAGYEENLSEMETIIKQLPMVKKIIKENKELKRRLESENIHISVDEKQESADVREDIKKELNDNMDMSFKSFHDMMIKQESMGSDCDSDTNHSISDNESDLQITRKMKITGLGAVGIATGTHTHFQHDESEEVGEDNDSVSQSLEDDSEQVVVLDRTNFHQEVIRLDASEEEEEEDSGSQPQEDEEEEEEDSGTQPQEDEEEEEEEEEEDSGSQPQEDEEEDEEEEEEVFEINIDDTVYYTTNEKNGDIYSCTIDGDVGEAVGHFENGKPLFS